MSTRVRNRISILGTVLAILLPVSSTSGFAQAASTGGATQTAAEGLNRLFLAFPEDATVIPGQWWEGQLRLVDGDPVDANILGLVFALRPYEDLEFGGAVGFGSTDAPRFIPDGSGATDLDLWFKWGIGAQNPGETQFALGGMLTVPTGDDTAGLGTDAFQVAVFASMRQPLTSGFFTAHVGLRATEDGRIHGIPLDGKTSGLLGVGIVLPVRDRLSVVGEAVLETESFEGMDDDFRVLGGVNWRAGKRGLVRAALGLGLSDGAPDAEVLLGYAVTY